MTTASAVAQNRGAAPATEGKPAAGGEPGAAQAGAARADTGMLGNTQAPVAKADAGKPPAVKHWITLITGDRIAVDARGRPAGLTRAKGRERIPIQFQQVDGDFYAVPLDAARLISSGRVDRRLFDVTSLSKPAYRASQRKGLKLIVRYQGEQPAARVGLRTAGATKVRHSFTRLNADAVITPPQGATAVWNALTSTPRDAGPFRAAAAGIDTVWLDGIRTASLDKSVPQIGAPEAWAAGYDGKGTKIAVLDTGVDQTHPDLAGQEIAEKNFSSAPDNNDRVGHGTHVASITAGTGAKSGGKYRGVAPGAKILDGKVLDDTGSGEDSGILAGLEWAAAEKADVVNLSLGGEDTPETDPLEAAVNKLSADTGTLFVIAAGNDGPDSGTIGSPGSADAALTVGAVDKEDRLADFSSTGPRIGDGAVKPDVTAPGVSIGAAAAPGSLMEREGTPVADGYVALSGTSMATPHVAGAAAILAQQHPRWSGDQIKALLTGSTTPGKGYSPFQQGTGRIDLRKAVKQTVLAKPGSVSLGKQLYPHTDDKPVTKKITYRNLGTKPVTLTLAITGTGPDGKPAPKGFFTLGKKQITIPPKGEKTTSITADTRLGGDVNGTYSAYITATGGGQTVRTAAGVEREIESYDVTVTHLGRNGRAAKNYTTDLVGLTGAAEGQQFSITSEGGDRKVRVPKGRYILSGTVLVDGIDDDWKGADWINQPTLQVTKDTAVMVDARTAKPVDITVPNAAATPGLASADVMVSVGDYSMSTTWNLDSYQGFRTAHLGPKAAPGELREQFQSNYRTAGNGPEYFVTYGRSETRFATGFTRHAAQGDFAKLTAKLGASVAGKRGSIAAFGETGVGIARAAVVLRKLPYTGTLYVNGKGPRWALSFEQVDANGDAEVAHDTGYAVYQPGKAYAKVFNVGVFGPKLGSEFGLFRDGNEITGTVPLFADGAHHTGGSVYDKAKTTLYRNGVQVGSNDDPMTGTLPFKVPAARADYKLTTSVTRSKVASVSTKIAASWSFPSKKVTNATKLPASVVCFTPSLSLGSTGKAGATVKVPVSVQGSAAGGNLTSLAVYVSRDNGAHWKKLSVTAGKVTVRNPAAGKAVSFRAHAVDKQGNAVDQTIYNAYLTK
ncbi:S8 family serine peptidase [Streptomyces sp. NA02950]|uniref:S8 family peptidase n=1 Tax=Streptomyces sp. NA02950 TaxID=2742137 RepID=UPI001591D0B9|nr:S8 family serine peptidase [Streptomyces sp. NA02950]QKV90715.1 S8 family serine peptidase [Streptomyces sp. NA02950]